MATNLLEGERALVTACGGGVAMALKPDGATVLGSDIKAPSAEDRIDFLASDLGQRSGRSNPFGPPGYAGRYCAKMTVAMLSERFGRYVVGTAVEVDGSPGLISWIPAKA